MEKRKLNLRRKINYDCDPPIFNGNLLVIQKVFGYLSFFDILEMMSVNKNTRTIFKDLNQFWFSMWKKRKFRHSGSKKFNYYHKGPIRYGCLKLKSNKTALNRAGISHFDIKNTPHVICTDEELVKLNSSIYKTYLEKNRYLSKSPQDGAVNPTELGNGCSTKHWKRIKAFTKEYYTKKYDCDINYFYSFLESLIDEETYNKKIKHLKNSKRYKEGRYKRVNQMWERVKTEYEGICLNLDRLENVRQYHNDLMKRLGKKGQIEEKRVKKRIRDGWKWTVLPNGQRVRTVKYKMVDV
tara:strand:+ start:5415 stop:6302 length:888 start_codon:yes stop_codon:yes gene_type:complete